MIVYRYQDGTTRTGTVRECIIKQDNRDYYRINYTKGGWEVVSRFQLWIEGGHQGGLHPQIDSYPPWGTTTDAQSQDYVRLRNQKLEWATNKVREAVKNNVLNPRGEDTGRSE